LGVERHRVALREELREGLGVVVGLLDDAGEPPRARSVGIFLEHGHLGAEVEERLREHEAELASAEDADAGRHFFLGRFFDDSRGFLAGAAGYATSFSRSFGSSTASMRIANSAALVAPAGPMAKVAVGTPAGICTMLYRLSTPASAFDGTGTPSTGSVVS